MRRPPPRVRARLSSYGISLAVLAVIAAVAGFAVRNPAVHPLALGQTGPSAGPSSTTQPSATSRLVALATTSTRPASAGGATSSRDNPDPTFAPAAALASAVPTTLEPSPPPPSATPTPESTATPPPTPSPTPAHPPGKGVRLPLVEPRSLDPAFASAPEVATVVLQLFQGLAAPGPDGQVLGLDAERWEISEDRTVYTFHLRPSLRWSDGRPLTAHDYIYAWRRNLDPATGSPLASLLYPIKNATAVHKGRLPASALGVAAPDPHTLEVTLERPTGHFLALLATAAYAPQPAAAAAGLGPDWGDPRRPASNGPFKVLEWEAGQRLLLGRNELAAGAPARLDWAEYEFFAPGDWRGRLARYLAGDLEASGPLPTDEALPLIRAAGAEADLRISPRAAVAFLVLNHRQDYLRDARVRQALGMAIDRAQLVARLGRPYRPARSLLPPTVPGLSQDGWPGESAAEARELLATAGYPNGEGLPELWLPYDESVPLWRVTMAYIAERWREVLGVRVRLEPRPPLAMQDWRRDVMQLSNFDASPVLWIAQFNDPAAWYNGPFLPENDGAYFKLRWYNATIDLEAAAAAAAEAEERAQHYAAANALLAQQYPLIPLFYPTQRELVRPTLEGYGHDAVVGAAPLRMVELAERDEAAARAPGAGR